MRDSASLKLLIATVLAVTAVCHVQADSPLTSTPFHEAYDDVEIVATAQESGDLDRSMGAFLSDPEQPIDVKAALVNALGWDMHGQDNADIYLNQLGNRYARREFELRDHFAELLQPHEMFCLGYLLAMDDYFEPEVGIPMLEEARRRLPESYTVALVTALVRAQHAMDQDWCDVWLLAQAVDDDPVLNRDLRPRAREIILEYLVLYRSYCEGEEPDSEEYE